MRRWMVVVAIAAVVFAIPWRDFLTPLAMAAALAVAGVVFSGILSLVFVMMDRCVDAWRSEE